MSTQQSLFIPKLKEPFQVLESSIYTPSAGELVVKIHTIALNPVDWKIQAYDILKSQYPLVPGSDASGTVHAIGEGVTDFQVGDKVFYQGFYDTPAHGTFQQYSVVPAEIVAKIPSKLSFDEAATVPLGFITAFIGMYHPTAASMKIPYPWESATFGSGKPFFVVGGSSSVGQYVIQLAKASGFSPIITTASSQHAEYLKSLGATHVFDRTKPASEFISEFGHIQYIYDAISTAETQTVAYEVYKGGDIPIVLSLILFIEKVPGKPVVSVAGSGWFDFNRPVAKELWKQLPKLLEEDKIKPNRFELAPGGLHGVPDGLDKMRANGVSGVKLIYHV